MLDPDAAVNVGNYGRGAVSLALDRANGLHVSYVSGDYGQDQPRKIKYAVKPAAGPWSTSILDPQPPEQWLVDGSSDTSVAADSAGGVHVTYADRYAFKPAGGPWSITQVPYCRSDALAADGNSGVHRACGGDLRTGTRYGFKPAGGSWSNSTFDPEDSTYVALAVDPSGRPHVAYTLNHYQARKVIKYAFKTPSGVWSIDEPLTLPAKQVDVGMSVSLALDAARGLHLSYSNVGGGTATEWIEGALMYAFKPAGGSWSSSKMQKEPEYAALAVDAAGGAYIAYVSLGLEYLYKPAGGSWSINRIDPSAGYAYPSIAIDTSGILHVVYYAGGLKYARICPTS